MNKHMHYSLFSSSYVIFAQCRSTVKTHDNKNELCRAKTVPC